MLLHQQTTVKIDPALPRSSNRSRWFCLRNQQLSKLGGRSKLFLCSLSSRAFHYNRRFSQPNLKSSRLLSQPSRPQRPQR